MANMQSTAGLPTQEQSKEPTQRLVPEEIPENLRKLLGSNIAVDVRCGSCIHFRNMQNAAYGAVCEKLGVLPQRRPCNRYTPDHRQLNVVGVPQFAAFAAVLSMLSDAQVNLVASLLMRESRTRRCGFRFGESVYLRVYGGDYFNNYRRALVVAAYKNYVLIEGANGFHAMIFNKSLLTHAQWKKKAAALQAARMIDDPNAWRYVKKQTAAEKHVSKVLDDEKIDLFTRGEGEFLMTTTDAPEVEQRRKTRKRGYIPLTEVFTADNEPVPAAIRTRQSRDGAV